MRALAVILGLVVSNVGAAQGGSSRLEAVVEHYQRVERELRAADVSHLTDRQRQARANVVDLLRTYRERGVFGMDPDLSGGRRPYFVDAEGRRCAVAALLDGTGSGSLTLEIAAHSNDAWIADLTGSQELGEWLAEHGLSLADAARIQAPTIISEEPEAESPLSPFEVPWQGYTGPGDSIEGSQPSGSASAGRQLIAAGLAVRSAAASSRARGMPLARLGAEPLQVWWEWNRRAFLPPRVWNQVPVSVARTASKPLARERDAATKLVADSLLHDDPRVRAAAVLATGRIAGAGAVAALREAMDDPSLGVRHTAVLGLGAAGSPSATHALLRIAHDERAHRLEDRALALLALGIATPRGESPSMVPILDRLLRGASPAEKETLGAAAMAFVKLTGAAGLHGVLRDHARDVSESPLVRARAAENLVGAADSATVADLTRSISDRTLDLRRSAALALGQSEHALALPTLMTAFELENELLTRGFVLVAIGRQGGAGARQFLIEQVTAGKKPLRPWAGIGLGMIARRGPDPQDGQALRRGWENEHNHDLRGIWLIALGLARDPSVIESARQVLRTSNSSMVRAAAVEALALCGDPRAAPSLRETLGKDSCPYVRGTAADALAHLGHAGDARLLADRLRAERDPSLRARLAVAIGASGTGMGLQELLKIRTENEGPDLQAAVVQATGALLSRRGERDMPRLASLANFTLFPGWLAWALAHDL